ncbi:hypothetical protein NNRS527_00112 [Nitrosospira sp. NRS527]|nr:hypothetical protein NNRS527_00112 [Nitrosospira sp. NRS527]
MIGESGVKRYNPDYAKCWELESFKASFGVPVSYTKQLLLLHSILNPRHIIDF